MFGGAYRSLGVDSLLFLHSLGQVANGVKGDISMGNAALRLLLLDGLGQVASGIEGNISVVHATLLTGSLFLDSLLLFEKLALWLLE